MAKKAPKKPTYPDETCERCRKVITLRARANLIGQTIACTPCYKKYHASRLPLEKCQRCEKTIGPNARANLIGKAKYIYYSSDEETGKVRWDRSRIKLD